eukprot:1136827-Rhodomonas_salina.3
MPDTNRDVRHGTPGITISNTIKYLGTRLGAVRHSYPGRYPGRYPGGYPGRYQGRYPGYPVSGTRC